MEKDTQKEWLDNIRNQQIDNIEKTAHPLFMPHTSPQIEEILAEDKWKDDLRKITCNDICFIDSLSQQEVVSIERFISTALLQATQRAYQEGREAMVGEMREKISKPSDIRTADCCTYEENNFDFGYDTKTNEVLSLLELNQEI